MAILFFDQAYIKASSNVVKTCFKEAFSTKSNKLKNIFISCIPVAGYLFTVNKDWLESKEIISSSKKGDFVESIKLINAKNYNKIFLIINKLVLGILLIPVSGYFLCLAAVASIANLHHIIKNHSVIENFENHYTFTNVRFILRPNLLKIILPWINCYMSKENKLESLIDVTIY